MGELTVKITVRPENINLRLDKILKQINKSSFKSMSELKRKRTTITHLTTSSVSDTIFKQNDSQRRQLSTILVLCENHKTGY